MEEIRILIADDHPLFREGLCRLFQDEKDMECVAMAEDGKEAVRLTQELCPDVAILDVNMPELTGIDAARQIKKTCPKTAILMLSAYKYNHYVITSLQAGVDGYLLKNTPRSELIEAIRMIHSGKGVFNLEAISKVLRKLTSGTGSAKSGPDGLRSRELEVLKLAARGMSNKQISRELNITDNTVGTHLVNVFRKLGVESRTEAALYALKEGLISTDDIASKGET
jgi:DNA-binding NarL/FixJ family response regulator